jgi:SAM-dependent methyltransferase
MTKPRLPIEIPNQGYLLADVPPGIFDDTFRLATQRLDAFVAAALGELVDALALPTTEPMTPAGLVASKGWVPAGELLVRWLLETLELFGYAEVNRDGWRLTGSRPLTSATGLRAEAEALLPTTRPTYEMMSLALSALPAILRGETRGEDVLFGPSTLALWFEYMANANVHYGPNNAVTAAALVRRLGPGARILEVGGGAGGAAQAILQRCAAQGVVPTAYVFTDIHPAFLRRGFRLVQQSTPAGCQVSSSRYDFNQAPAAQGVEPGSFDAVVAVNALHLAHDLASSLQFLRAVLRPGGSIAIGELVRPDHGAVHLELPFLLLEAYRSVALDPDVRPRPGFMKAGGWRVALERAGYSGVALTPVQLARCVETYPGFFCGAFIATA